MNREIVKDYDLSALAEILGVEDLQTPDFGYSGEPCLIVKRENGAGGCKIIKSGKNFFLVGDPDVLFGMVCVGDWGKILI
jgi:hypothetical protein